MNRISIQSLITLLKADVYDLQLSPVLTQEIQDKLLEVKADICHLTKAIETFNKYKDK